MNRKERLDIIAKSNVKFNIEQNKDLSWLSEMFQVYDNETMTKHPLKLYPKQKEIFNIIANRYPRRSHIMCYSQYGKSFSVGLAVLLRAVTHPEKWAIVAPTKDKAMIIMKVILEHIFDHEVFESQLAISWDSKERLKREMSKTRITFKWGWEIFVVSADSKNKKDAGEALMWLGAPNIVLDESCLIDDDIYGKIFRMLGGFKNNFILEIGNPFNRNHFITSYYDESYYKVIVDWKEWVLEGRQNEDFFQEAKTKSFFNVLYDCDFPDEMEVDKDGWSTMFLEDEIRHCFRDAEHSAFGEPKLGLDIAGHGNNYSVWVLRQWGHAKVVSKTSSNNTMDIIGNTIELMEKFWVKDENVFMDATGAWVVLYDLFKSKGYDFTWVNMAQSATDKEKYINVRAELFFRLREWLKKWWTLEENNAFLQLMNIKYKVRESGKVKIIDKVELRQRGIASPDEADALCLTFMSEDDIYSTEKKEIVLKKRFQQASYE